jgi:hypothetical protein
MLLAQAILEYGMLSAIEGGFLQFRADIEDMARHPQPMHYAVAGLVVVGLWLMKGRRA